MTENLNEFKIGQPPTDGITSLQFSPNSSQYLLVSSWDSSVRLYDINANTMRIQYKHSAPVLDCCFHDATHAYSGDCDNNLKMYDFNAGQEKTIGSHRGPIRCVEYCSDANAIATGSWDSSVKLWDPRSGACVGTYQQPDRVYAMTVCADRLVVGTAGRKVWIWDLRAMSQVQQKRESSLKYQIRCIAGFPSKQGYVLSSIEGRVAVEYFDPSPEVQKKKYAFKCHRIKENAVEMIYPVNAIAFHNHYNTFASGGSDGLVNIWDGFNKKRLCQFHRYPTSISSLAFSHDGSVLAIASSYMYEDETQDDKQHPDDAIFIRRVTDQETKPK